MFHANRLVASILVALLPGAAVAQDTASPDEAALDARLAELERRVAHVKAKRAGDWMTETRAAEIRGLVHEVLADADTRASLLQGGVTGGYDKGFFVGSADGNFVLNFSGQVQLRWLLNIQDRSPRDDTRSGFENRRTKLGFDGHVFDPSWRYKIRGNFARAGGAFNLQSAWIRKDLDDEWSVRFGQFKAPLVREELVSSRRQLFVDRSIVDRAFDQRYSQGVEVRYRDDRLKLEAAVTDGLNTANTAALAADTELALTGRAEMLLLDGKWGKFDDFTSERGSDTGLLIGAAAHYETGESGTGATDDELLRWTIDASLELDGANLMVAVIGSHLDRDVGLDLDQYGLVVQGGYYLTDELEAIARYEYADGDTGIEDVSVITIGANYYLDGHAAKLTADVGYALDPIDAMFASPGTGWREDTPGQDGQVVVRTQFQLLF